MKIELAHDILAKKIYDRASAEDKMLIKVHHFIATRYVYYLDSRVTLDQNGINYITPYLSKMTLGKEEEAFIQKSVSNTKRKRRTATAITVITCAILLIFGIQASKTFYDLHVSINNKKLIRKKLDKTKNARNLAELKAQKLLEQHESINQEDLNDVAIIKQMLIQYDTLGKQQVNALKERDLAQSATLSDLAQSAKTQKDKKYAFQLAVKAWELNNDNNQALELLEELSEEKVEIEEISFSELPEDAQNIIIKEEQQKAGKLKDNDLDAIFAKENIVVQGRSAGVKKIVQATKTNPRKKKKSKKEGSEAPIIHQIIQQQPSPKVPIVQPLKNTNRPSDCSAAKRQLNQWIPLKETRNLKISILFKTSQLLYFKLTTTRNTAPKKTGKLKLHLSLSESIHLVLDETTDQHKIYVAKLHSSDRKLLQQKLIIGFSLTPLDNNPAVQEVIQSKKIFLTPDVQKQLLMMSKCLL